MNNEGKKQKVYVGMSGGVDSSLTAALLKEQGFDVVGVFIKVWQPDFTSCNWREERRDAMRVATLLDIPFKTINLEDEYKREVVDYMISEYKKGRTPNPDVMCNRQIKFGGFLEKALEEGADFIATGHYARNIDNRLYKGKDLDKDQSYFLWTLKSKDLEKVLFPIGEMTKAEVREEARKRNLPVADKKDSQGICFVGKIDVKEFLKNYIPEKQGNVLNEKGEVIGEHFGAEFFTIGERHGFTITKKTPNDKPVFVVAKDVEKNTLTVSEEPKKEEFNKKVVELEEVSWVGRVPSGEVEARIRYRQDLKKCRIEGEKAIFNEVQPGVTPGQSLVVYDGEECLGGGVIK